MGYSEAATDLFRSGFNCAQSVLAVFCEKYGLPRETALKAASGLGGGMRCGEICGAVSGGVLVIGLKYGQNLAGDIQTKELCNKKTAEFLRLFSQRNKSVVCRDILGIDIFKGDGMAKAKEKGLFSTVCVNMIVSAVELLEDMGY